MGYTDLEFVWEADIDDTEGRVQADGSWVGSFASEPELPVENIILRPGFEMSADTAAVPDNRQVNPDAVVPARFGEGINPDVSPGAWVDLRDAWWSITSNNQILDTGYWPLPNIGVASPLPVRWFGLTDGLATTYPAEQGGLVGKEYEAVLGRSGEVIQIGNIIFSSKGSAPAIGGPFTFIAGDLFLFRHSDNLTNIDHKGVMFLHLSVAQETLSWGVIGETYLPTAAISTLDFFHGYAFEFEFVANVPDEDGNLTQTAFTADLFDTANTAIPIFGGTADRSIFQVLPVRANIKQTRFFDRFASGFYWQRTLRRIGGSTSDPQYQGFVSALDDRRNTSYVTCTLRWGELGGVGRDVLPYNE